MKLSSEALMTELRWSNFVAPVRSRWQHKYGGRYQVIGHGFSTERQQIEVLYVRIDGPDWTPAELAIFFTRPTTEWTTDRFQEIA